jgi:putative ABC transport system ATP-binding protein
LHDATTEVPKSISPGLWMAPRNHAMSKPSSLYIVEVENAWKVYQTGSVQVEALRGVNMGVKKGEMVAVMGPSGCGKTTLLNCFSGLDDLSKGKVTIEGVGLAEMSDDQKSEFRAKRMGFIFQAYNLLPVLTAQENIELPLLLAGIPESDAHVAALDTLKMVGLTDWRSHKPMELSGGQQQRVTIARALVNKPAIVWADEPTGNLDSENSQEIIKLLRSLNQQYALTVVLVSHDPSIAQQMDRIVHMRNGQIEKEVKLTNVAS